MHAQCSRLPGDPHDEYGLLLLLLLLQTCAQVLLTLDNLADRSQYINARNTFVELLAYGTIPVVNENVSRAWQASWHGAGIARH